MSPMCMFEAYTAACTSVTSLLALTMRQVDTHAALQQRLPQNLKC